jgi:hypothetical protein
MPSLGARLRYAIDSRDHDVTWAWHVNYICPGLIPSTLADEVAYLIEYERD